MSAEWLIVCMIVSLVVGLLMGGHLAVVLGSVGIVFGIIGWGPSILPVFSTRVYGVMTDYLLIAVPLFIFMGFVISMSGLAEDLYAAVDIVSKKIKGGMVVATVLFGAVFAMCTGVVAASIITAGVLCLPPMLQRGYPKGISLGAVGAGGTLGILIPPSVMIVFYASETGLSTGKLFAAAYAPGMLLALLFILYIVVRFTIEQEPDRGRMQVVEDTDESSNPEKSSLLKILGSAVLLFGLIFSVVGTIIGGIATPTEASAAGAMGALIIALCYGRLNVNMVKESALKTISTVGMVGLLLVGSLAFSSAFLGLGANHIVADLILCVSSNPNVVLVIMLSILFFLGMLLDWIPIFYITLPVFIPISEQMGWNPVWFAIVICVTLQTAWLTPPFGFALFFLKGIAPPGVTYMDIIKGSFPFMLVQILGVIILIIFPKLVTFLPDLLMN